MSYSVISSCQLPSLVHKAYTLDMRSEGDVKQIHHYVFPVETKPPLRDTGFDSGYDWVSSGNGKWMRIKRKPDVENEIVLTEALNLAIDKLRTDWFKENAGIVAATLTEGDLSIAATSQYIPSENRWVHAEAAVLRQFEVEFGRRPKESSTMVVTLSPCILESKSRLGEACSHKILESGISHVRFGCLDIKQTPQIEIFEQIGLDAKFIGNAEQRRVCESLYALFDQLYIPGGRLYHLLGKSQNPWIEVKKLIGVEPFQG